jgi:MFS family permease
MTAVVSDPAQRAALQQRALRVLALGQVVGGAALASAVTVGAFVVQDILGHDTPWAGTATAVTTTGTAFMSQVLARKMSRHGRRPGLRLGYGLAAVGGGIAAVGVETGSLIVFIVGLFVFGNGQAANLLARYAATDLAEPDERSRAMSRIVFASTFGAVLGPILIGPAADAGQRWFDLDKYTGPWLLGAVLFTLAMANTALRLRPDPWLRQARLLSSQPRTRGSPTPLASSPHHRVLGSR